MTAIAEKYARAIGSSHLEWKLEPGAIDTLTAAGMIQETLGTGLLRLRAEFDSISTMPDARNMLPRLKSASGVRLRLMGLIVDRGGDANAALDLAARLMDQWCDPSCATCTGRGSIGGYGAPQLICSTCGGSKRREMVWGQDEQNLADRVMGDMESMVDTAQRRIRRLLRQD